jgi:hypothetical protein
MRRIVFSLATALAIAGCGGTTSTSTPQSNPDAGSVIPSDLVPDFALVDTNSTSTLSGTEVSPRQFMQKVSGWYFTHSS